MLSSSKFSVQLQLNCCCSSYFYLREEDVGRSEFDESEAKSLILRGSS